MALVVLVSGCSSGLGRALAYELHTQENRMTGEHADPCRHATHPPLSSRRWHTASTCAHAVARAQESLCTEYSLRPESWRA